MDVLASGHEGQHDGSVRSLASAAVSPEKVPKVESCRAWNLESCQTMGMVMERVLLNGHRMAMVQMVWHSSTEGDLALWRQILTR